MRGSIFQQRIIVRIIVFVVLMYRRVLYGVSSALVFTPYYPQEHPSASLVVDVVSRATAIFGSATSNHPIQGPRTAPVRARMDQDQNREIGTVLESFPPDSVSLTLAVYHTEYKVPYTVSYTVQSNPS